MNSLSIEFFSKLAYVLCFACILFCLFWFHFYLKYPNVYHLIYSDLVVYRNNVKFRNRWSLVVDDLILHELCSISGIFYRSLAI